MPCRYQIYYVVESDAFLLSSRIMALLLLTSFSWLLCGYMRPFYLMPRLHMQVWQPGTERQACIKVFSCYLGKSFSQTSGFVPGCQNR